MRIVYYIAMYRMAMNYQNPASDGLQRNLARSHGQATDDQEQILSRKRKDSPASASPSSALSKGECVTIDYLVTPLFSYV